MLGALPVGYQKPFTNVIDQVSFNVSIYPTIRLECSSNGLGLGVWGNMAEVSRRAIVKTAAWAVPVVTLAVAAPAAAASGSVTDRSMSIGFVDNEAPLAFNGVDLYPVPVHYVFEVNLSASAEPILAGTMLLLDVSGATWSEWSVTVSDEVDSLGDVELSEKDGVVTVLFVADFAASGSVMLRLSALLEALTGYAPTALSFEATMILAGGGTLSAITASRTFFAGGNTGLEAIGISAATDSGAASFDAPLTTGQVYTFSATLRNNSAVAVLPGMSFGVFIVENWSPDAGQSSGFVPFPNYRHESNDLTDVANISLAQEGGTEFVVNALIPPGREFTVTFSAMLEMLPDRAELDASFVYPGDSEWTLSLKSYGNGYQDDDVRDNSRFDAALHFVNPVTPG
jgi:hypothetical protein